MTRPKKSAPEKDNFLCYEMGSSWVNCQLSKGRVFIDSCNFDGDIGLSLHQARYFANKILLMAEDYES
jgi:hypothetical protein